MNFKENKPIYLQIAERIMDEILQRVYSEGERIPSVREYASMVEVNANTVVRSFDYLQTKGIIYTKRGLGYFVSPGASEQVVALRRQSFIDDELPEMFRGIHLLNIPFEEIAHRYREYLRCLHE